MIKSEVMKIVVTAGMLFLGGLFLSAQQIASDVYWIYFTDKSGTPFQLDQPEDFLSQRSIERRAWQGLSIDQRDMPVNDSYVEGIRELGIEVKHVSRWLNGVAMKGIDQGQFDQVEALPYTTISPWEPDDPTIYTPPKPTGSRFSQPLETPPDFSYGVAREQVSMLNIPHLHNAGYTGGGVWVAVLDAGFRDVDSLPSFQPMIGDGRLLGTRNFVQEKSVFREKASHGMYVLSVMASEWDGYVVGSAPHATYFLCTTEDVDQETRIEELAWVEAAEFVDSLGFDVINTSLGYGDMDGFQFDYQYADMDGKTTFISRAASLTASRGILACNSAGNQGNKSWYYITAPADATDILAVGAVDSSANLAWFSSRGPTVDQRTKPDIVGMGVITGFQSHFGGLARANGTSFSSPLLAGAVASLWQAVPEHSAKEMIQLVTGSGDQYDQPDNLYGYGLPDFAMILGALEATTGNQMKVFPNPATDRVMLAVPGSSQGTYTLRFYDLSGRVSVERSVSLPGTISLPDDLPSGAHILEVRSDDQVYRSWIIKQ